LLSWKRRRHRCQQRTPMAETGDGSSEKSMLMPVLMLTHVKVPQPW
jgi:hypothetical protein